jgi:hypothetical protein
MVKKSSRQFPAAVAALAICTWPIIPRMRHAREAARPPARPALAGKRLEGRIYDSFTKIMEWSLAIEFQAKER